MCARGHQLTVCVEDVWWASWYPLSLPDNKLFFFFWTEGAHAAAEPEFWCVCVPRIVVNVTQGAALKPVLFTYDNAGANCDKGNNL